MKSGGGGRAPIRRPRSMIVELDRPSAAAIVSQVAPSVRIWRIRVSCASVHWSFIGIREVLRGGDLQGGGVLVYLSSILSTKLTHRFGENSGPPATYGLAPLGGLTYGHEMSDSQAIGERIRLARQERGLTQEQLAEAVGVTRSAVAQWETGRAGQVTGNLSRIAAVLEVGVEHLMFGDDKTAPQLATRGHELAMLRLYRDCAPADQQLLLRTARRLAGR